MRLERPPIDKELGDPDGAASTPDIDSNDSAERNMLGQEGILYYTQ